MWTPPDAYALPSKEEIQYMQLVIRDLETQLHLAVHQGSCSQGIADNLEQELQQRKAWIAPIRRVPHDVLSLIFVQTCKIDPNAPFILGGVAKIWRSSLLDTPQAWTYVRLNHLKTLDATQFVLDRGSPYPLYLDVDAKSSPHLILALEGHTERIRCLRMESSFIRLLQNPFSNLTKLAVSGENTEGAIRDPWDLLDSVKFPNLRCLCSGFLLDSMASAPPPHHLLPPIEELSISTRDPRFIARVIRKLADKLTLLRILLVKRDYSTEDDQPTEISFPKLHDLTIMEPLSRDNHSLWPFNARTPALLYYTQFPGSPGHNIHKDTQTVTRLAFLLKIDFQLFPKLREVTSGSAGIDSLMESLEANPQGLPTIETIHCKYEVFIKERVDAFNVQYGRKIECHMMEQVPAFLLDSFHTWSEFSGRYGSL